MRATVNDRWFFRIKRESLRPAGLKRLLRLERYNQYKIDLLAEAKRNRFVLPEQGAHVVFFIPVPKSWRKHKKEAKHLTLHDSTPDIDNCAKAMLDSLLPEDKKIADIRLTKKWVNADRGYIEVTVDLPQFPSRDTLL